MNRMKLLAMDKDDLNVISTYVQDAVVLVGDLSWSKKDSRFLIQMNRFVWENENSGRKKKSFERRRSVLHFNLVDSVRSQGLRQEEKEAVLSLLAISFKETDAPEGVITLNFSGGATIELNVECLEAQLSDLDGAWATKHKPEHDLTDS